ncbi:MAG: DUF58 domain-containing protein [Planctomycetota bacterium]
MRESKKYLDPGTLNRISGLELRARRVVEGYLAGLHRSPYHGWSVEFAEHRPYSPGDELRHIDWKLWARSDRFFVKLYEEETNVRAQFLVDASASMGYASGQTTKYDYGCTLAASLAYLLLTQRDAVGLTLFDDDLRAELPPAANPGRLRSFCRLLQQAAPRGQTDLGNLLHRVADRLSGRGIVVLVSDLFGPVDDLHSALQRFRYEGHAVIVVHVLDPAEAEFPFDGNVRFEGLEEGRELATGAGEVREAYLEAFRRFTDSVQRACAELEADYVLADTRREAGATLFRFLSARAANR